ncbi:hypothetical protein BCR33DRAFT_797584 [Rhizoclosmatium globosum]|uniref:Uncharacterized protein n=1 Tax=Rhizoclosmatium globosum TaxID=329046 RepID=A0A1Y2AH07_9FUNG|nr:hypothetical protein BCR33DRAFT_797584 [Rhizoclosmatium globosum]|eukprot:ORY21762.1 hypothetical protein BCR33DRAFT_797584 [Rhizoclosmatium globosum]
MNPAWWSYIPISILDYQLLRARMGQMEENGNGFLSPVVQCLIAILEEIDYIKYRGQQDDVTKVADDIEGLELGMQVLSIGASKGQRPEKVIEPYVFLGLLGLKVAGGIRWKGRSEESWRLFWKLNG